MVEDKLLHGEILEEELYLTLAELCRVCDVSAESIVSLVEEGVLEPAGEDMRQWRFSGESVTRVRVVARLQQDLGVNLSGAALALELMEEIRLLRARLEALGLE